MLLMWTHVHSRTHIIHTHQWRSISHVTLKYCFPRFFITELECHIVYKTKIITDDTINLSVFNNNQLSATQSIELHQTHTQSEAHARAINARFQLVATTVIIKKRLFVHCICDNIKEERKRTTKTTQDYVSHHKPILCKKRWSVFVGGFIFSCWVL